MNTISRISRIGSKLATHSFLRWPHASLRVYLVIMILLSTVPIAALMSYQIFDQVEIRRERAQEDLERTVSVMAQSVNRELESSIDALTILSYAGEIQRGEVDLFEKSLRNRPVSRQSWSGMYLLALDGTVLFDTAHAQLIARQRYDMLDLLRRLSESNKVVSNLEQDSETGKYYTAVEVPVLIDGLPRFVLGALIPVATWHKLGRETGLVEPGISSLVDRDFSIISRNRSTEAVVGTTMPKANQTFIQSSERGSAMFQSLEGGTSNGTWARVPLAGWTALVGYPSAPVDAAYHQAIFAALATAAACLLAGVYLALLVARRLTVPLRQLARNNFHDRSEPIPVREISLLRDALVMAQEHDEMNRQQLRRKRDLLQNTANEFQSLLASSPVAIGFAQDSACERITHNAAMDQMFGQPTEEGVRDLQILEDGILLTRAQLPLQRAAALGEWSTDRELEIRIEGRPTTFVLCNAVPLFDDAGRPRGAIAGAVDITERKAAEARLIEAEQQLRESQRLVDLAQESGQVGFFHYQMDNDVLAWTPGKAKLFGLDGGEVESLTEWTRRIKRTDWQRMTRELRWALGRKKESVTLDYRVEHSGGDVRWLSSRVRLIYAESGRSYELIGITVDMTEQKIAEHERDALIVREQSARREAEAANRAKDEFLAMLGHELRNPLSAISSGVEVLQRVDCNSETASNARKIVARQTRHLAHMLDDLLDVARVMNGRVVIEREPLNLAALVERIVANFELAADTLQHLLTVSVQECWVSASATRMEQVITNLLVNATKYTQPGGRIEISLRADSSQARLEVADNGVGIEPELLPRIFDLFVQGDRSLDRRAGGMGVGLTLVRRLVELQGGQVRARNGESGIGTVFEITLPAIAPPSLEASTTLMPSRPKLRVAIVEDNEDALEGLSTLLKLEGHTILSATDGTSGLALILGTRPDVAVVDIGLPGMSGYEVARHSRAGGYPGKLVALTGYGQDHDKRRAFAAGFDEHLLKPVSSRDLLRIIADQ